MRAVHRCFLASLQVEDARQMYAMVRQQLAAARQEALQVRGGPSPSPSPASGCLCPRGRMYCGLVQHVPAIWLDF